MTAVFFAIAVVTVVLLRLTQTYKIQNQTLLLLLSSWLSF